MSTPHRGGPVRNPQRRPLHDHLRALLLYAAVSLVLTWPLVAHFTTHVTGDGIDDPALAWNLWWIFARLVEQHHLDIFHVDWMFHPININLAFYTLTPLNGLLSVPLQSAFSLVVANNILLLSSFVLGAYGAFLLVHYLLGISMASRRESRATFWIAVTAGLVYGFASSKLFYASLGQFNIASSQWIPFGVLYLLRMAGVSPSLPPSLPPSSSPSSLRRGHDVALAALFLAFQAYAELTYASFLIIFAGLVFVWSVIVRGRGDGLRAVLQLTLRFVALGALFVLSIVPILAAMLPDMLREGDFFGAGGGFADVFSADLLGYLLPTRLHPLVGDWVAALPFASDKGQHIYLGAVVVLVGFVGLFGLLRSRAGRAQGWLWLGTTFFFWWLTLGPSLRWRGQDLGIPGPFAVVSQLPFFSGNRYPSRYSVMLMLCAAVLVGYGLRELWRTRLVQRQGWAPVALIGGFAALFMVEHLSAPLPLNDFRTPEIYARVAAEAGDSVVLELPTGWRNGARVLGKSDILIMMQQWYQTTHGKRRLGGNTSRNPPYKFQYFTEAPLIGDLIALMNSDDPRLAAYLEANWDDLVARNANAAEVLDFLGVDTLLLHVDKAPPLLQRFVDEVLPVEAVDAWQGPNWQGDASEIRRYSVRLPSTAWTEVDLGADEAGLHLAEGWAVAPTDGGVRYALRPEATLLLDLPQEAHGLALEVFAPVADIGVTINAQRLGTFTARDGWVSIPVPAGMGDELVDRVALSFDATPLSVRELAGAEQTSRPIGDTGAGLDASVSLLVRSAGEEVGDFAAIYVNGVDDSLNTRGYNLVALTPQGERLGRAAFDTFADEAQSNAMAAWIDQWPPGTIVAGAVADEASMRLNEAAFAALNSLGVAGDLRDRFRWSHAFVGVVGAEPGTALEDLQLIRPAAVSVGPPVDGANVYGGIGRVQLQKAP